jgi:MFS family permease
LAFAALNAPVVGPTLGGWITDSYSWRWVFLINVPVGLLALAGCYALLRDPDYLTTPRMQLRKQPFHFDSIGLSLLVIVMVSWEVMLSKGQEWDWLGDPFWRIQTLAIFFTVGLAGLIFWSCVIATPWSISAHWANATSPGAASSAFALISRSMPPGLRCPVCFSLCLVMTC